MWEEFTTIADWEMEVWQSSHSLFIFTTDPLCVRAENSPPTAVHSNMDMFLRIKLDEKALDPHDLNSNPNLTIQTYSFLLFKID